MRRDDQHITAAVIPDSFFAETVGDVQPQLLGFFIEQPQLSQPKVGQAERRRFGELRLGDITAVFGFDGVYRRTEQAAVPDNLWRHRVGFLQNQDIIAEVVNVKAGKCSCSMSLNAPR